MTSLHSSNQPYIKKYLDSPPTIANKRPSNQSFNLNKTPLNKPKNSLASSNSASSYSWAKNLDFDSIKDPFKKVDKIPQVSPAKIPHTTPSTTTTTTPTNTQIQIQNNKYSLNSNHSNNPLSSRPIKQPSFDSNSTQNQNLNQNLNQNQNQNLNQNQTQTATTIPNQLQSSNNDTLHQKSSQLDQLIIAARKKDRNEIYNIKLLEKKEKDTQKALPPPFQRHHKIPWVANKSILVSSVESNNLGLKSQLSQYSDASSSSIINTPTINHPKNLNIDSKLNTPNSLSISNPNCTNISHNKITTTNSGNIISNSNNNNNNSGNIISNSNNNNNSGNIFSNNSNSTNVDRSNLSSKKSEDVYNNIIDIYSTDFIYSESPSTPKSKNFQFFSPSNNNTNASNTSIFNSSQNFLFSKKSKANLNDSKPILDPNHSNLSFKNSNSNTRYDNSENSKQDSAFVTSTITAPIPYSHHNPNTNPRNPSPLANSNSNKDSKIRSSRYDDDSPPDGCKCACLIM
ncbi:hypothetical protein AYI70_g3023 [Smittium culicis]|uniref:Uncharacterized protein n=1 Tax=Smittium culicis TaxID=133412 RepID=A0A1R1WYK4_9FUNG|nr:hypothetical protein AYI70_g12166 [Smittium culicis]OMJ07493.1 hypothetical protein AYI70_g12138 [Smittium culicis]OMJ22229.1 hypothetical protein AYI70_g3023 [Smittium culicis]